MPSWDVARAVARAYATWKHEYMWPVDPGLMGWGRPSPGEDLTVAEARLFMREIQRAFEILIERSFRPAPDAARKFSYRYDDDLDPSSEGECPWMRTVKIPPGRRLSAGGRISLRVHGNRVGTPQNH